MRLTTLGALLTVAALAAGAIFAWRIVTGVETWLITSGAGHMLGWSLVAWIILAGAALPAWTWGIAAQAWVIKLRDGERLVATHRALIQEQEVLLEQIVNSQGT
ncbi:MAG: hypothetical protein EI684_05305 [Candidatus Viridilinea halotolerans]|uniref:Uncharacterized protein n=1 Tax=Candidatus Viridilinea halotolerans TaxID=2491704 RepID=A0A426U5I7_9CHLR|nr:MAG: hypothetical protein EI684_05305 [Candidatus Viridilinea halotolerans]